MSKKQNKTEKIHECIIGLLWKTDYAELATVEDLKKHIKENEEFNEYATRNGYLFLVKTVFHLNDYASRKTTDLEKFKFCPFCGNKIDLKTMLFENKEEKQWKLTKKKLKTQL